ncbi:hypothetical protein [Streptomyces mirabilis]|uniref:Uncharacterized protein n=1 Tax=Streptomyces mirabilis TaxID=68239 RepID=A0ABU3UKY1_9ACTN|nr:hypothetical protein [Streptomyces mirabilis]MDU8994508.1 hypothetical protein [Streptomyces mirabilis]
MTVKHCPPSERKQNAIQRPSRAAVGDRKDVAEGVRTALGPDPQTDDDTAAVARPVEFQAELRTLWPLLMTREGRAAS